MSPPPRSRLRRALFAGAAVCLSLAFLEGVGRVLERAVPWMTGPFEIHELPDPPGFEPGVDVGHMGLEHRINEGGYHGSYRPPERRPGTFRVAAMGDSTTFGWGVEPEEAWPAVLDEELGPDVEVLNFGVPGYNTWLQLVQWREQVRRYAPDLVLLGYYSNDAAIDRRVPNVYRICDEDPSLLPLLAWRAMDWSAFVRASHDAWMMWRTGSPLSPWASEVVLREEHFGFRCSMGWLEALRAEAEAEGVRFAVVQIPHLDGIGVGRSPDPEEEAQARLARALRQRRFQTIETYPALAEQDAERMLNQDEHPTAEAYSRFVDVLLSERESLGLPASR